MPEFTKSEKSRILIYLHSNLKLIDFNNLSQDLFFKKINSVKFLDSENLIAKIADVLFEDLDKTFLKEANLKVSKVNKISEKIHFLLSVRFKIEDKSSELINKILTHLIKTNQPNKIVTYIYSVADLIWISANDRSVDFNYYSKRLILSFVYSKILFLKLFKTSLKQNEIEQLISQSLNQVKIMSKLKLNLDFFKNIKDFFNFFTQKNTGRGF
jgi:ubiquinone biosynthesis protein COQ9